MTEIDDTSRESVSLVITYVDRLETVEPIRRDFAQLVQEALVEEQPDGYVKSEIRPTGS